MASSQYFLRISNEEARGIQLINTWNWKVMDQSWHHSNHSHIQAKIMSEQKQSVSMTQWFEKNKNLIQKKEKYI